jgi:Flp pilus assembly protein TadD
VGDDAVARELVATGEEAFAGGDAQAAAQRFAEAAARLPGLSAAWNNLAVTAHHLGLPDARIYVEHALFVAPHDRDALLNRGAIRLADGDRVGAQADAASVIERDPEDPDARQLLTLAG